MKNKIRKNQLGRKKAHREATLRNMANSLIKYGKIKTTKAKAKELKMFVEPLITRSKEDDLHNRRIVFSRLRDSNSVKVLFDEIGPRFKERPGGYTRKYLLGRRKTDASEMALIEILDEPMEQKTEK